ncbi:zinc finger ccch domain-containing protein [Anaeramoeba flamelloides]|uniref:Zinc finger ccch domain-containing protein n=1 Tax=Anaeramoeba flamelloides TaxID=1746091 RepID=A0AAV7ZWF6_9EUKA|nr:zinc finger ccch domain-containing protein [Anaeramoeba flamelloides]
MNINSTYQTKFDYHNNNHETNVEIIKQLNRDLKVLKNQFERRLNHYNDSNEKIARLYLENKELKLINKNLVIQMETLQKKLHTSSQYPSQKVRIMKKKKKKRAVRIKSLHNYITKDCTITRVSKCRSFIGLPGLNRKKKRGGGDNQEK